jgi:hypothetical protein
MIREETFGKRLKGRTVAAGSPALLNTRRRGKN